MKTRTLVLVLGDQLDPLSPAFEGFDAAQDLVWMAELPKESEHVKSHKARTALFLVDAVEWVELPNVLGMSQFADDGLMGSKPYVASGKYIQRMSNYCEHCRYDPAEATGGSACPFTTLYWDFLMRHEARFKGHPRAGLQWRNLSRLDEGKRALIRIRADTLKRQLAPSSA